MKEPEIEEMKAALIAAGWKMKRHDIWQSPSGAFYLGPYFAWKVMSGAK